MPLPQKSILFAVLLIISSQVHAEQPQYVKWGSRVQPLGECQDVTWYIDYSDNDFEYIKIFFRNTSGQRVMSCIDYEIVYANGHRVTKFLKAGTAPSGGYEGWINPSESTTPRLLSVKYEHSILEPALRPAMIRLTRFSVFTEHDYNTKVKPLSKGTYYTPCDIGVTCTEFLPVYLSWAVQKKEWKLGSFLQVVDLADNHISVRIDLTLDDSKTAVELASPFGQLQHVQFGHTEPYEMPMGRVWMVTLQLADPSAQMTVDGQTGRSDQAILYFYSKADALAAIESLEHARLDS